MSADLTSMYESEIYMCICTGADPERVDRVASPPPPFLKILCTNTKILIENYLLRANSFSVQQLPFRGEKKMMTLCFFCVIRCLF